MSHIQETYNLYNTHGIYCDGASRETGTGAAALDDSGISLRLHLADPDLYTAYDGELASLSSASNSRCLLDLEG